MHGSDLRLSRDELARRGNEAFDRQIRPALRAEDDVKFVAIDVESGQSEIDEDDHSAVDRLHRRVPGAQVWLVRAGYPTAHRLLKAA